MCAKALKEGEHMHQLKGSGTTEGRKRHRWLFYTSQIAQESPSFPTL
jgi:hypothetical protein